jgi:hypothetical protein
VTGAADPKTWYLVTCTDCGKPLKVLGAPPAKPICLHCDIIRAAPEEMRESIRDALRPLPEDLAR